MIVKISIYLICQLRKYVYKNERRLNRKTILDKKKATPIAFSLERLIAHFSFSFVTIEFRQSILPELFASSFHQRIGKYHTMQASQS